MFYPGDVVWCSVNKGLGQSIVKLVEQRGDQWVVNRRVHNSGPDVLATVPETDLQH